MVRIDSTYQGQLRCESSHEPSSTRLLTDAPRDNGGEGTSFSPTDLVATALGSCMLTTMGLVARRHGLAIEGATASVVKEMHDEPRRIGALRVVIELPAGLGSDALRMLERAARGCPVHRSLHPDMQVPVDFRVREDAP